MENKECAICLEEIGNTNSCVTPCGHKFCFNCMVKALKQKDTCPMCRTALQEESDKESDEESDEESTYLGDEFWNMRMRDFGGINFGELQNITANSSIATPNILKENFIKKGYTMEDMFVLYTRRIDRLNPRYTQRFIKNLEFDVQSIIQSTDFEREIEQIEINRMSDEDVRTEEINNMDIFERFPEIDLSRLFSELK
jgi:hypothetical protein